MPRGCMSLRMAVASLAKTPVPVVPLNSTITEPIPALYYTQAVEDAIEWLVDRYNDGTLQVIGYDRDQVIHGKKYTQVKPVYEDIVADKELKKIAEMKLEDIKNGKRQINSGSE